MGIVFSLGVVLKKRNKILEIALLLIVLLASAGFISFIITLFDPILVIHAKSCKGDFFGGTSRWFTGILGAPILTIVLGIFFIERTAEKVLTDYILSGLCLLLLVFSALPLEVLSDLNKSIVKEPKVVIVLPERCKHNSLIEKQEEDKLPLVIKQIEEEISGNIDSIYTINDQQLFPQITQVFFGYLVNHKYAKNENDISLGMVRFLTHYLESIGGTEPCTECSNFNNLIAALVDIELPLQQDYLYSWYNPIVSKYQIDLDILSINEKLVVFFGHEDRPNISILMLTEDLIQNWDARWIKRKAFMQTFILFYFIKKLDSIHISFPSGG